MKELLYIPDGIYINFSNNRDIQHSFESILEHWKMRGEYINEEELISRMLQAPNYGFMNEFFKINNLPEVSNLTREMFEIVER
jgi:hypothetical protein